MPVNRPHGQAGEDGSRCPRPDLRACTGSRVTGSTNRMPLGRRPYRESRSLLVERIIATVVISFVIVVAGGMVAGWLSVVVSAVALGGLASEHGGGRRPAPAGHGCHDRSRERRRRRPEDGSARPSTAGPGGRRHPRSACGSPVGGRSSRPEQIQPGSIDRHVGSQPERGRAGAVIALHLAVVGGEVVHAQLTGDLELLGEPRAVVEAARACVGSRRNASRARRPERADRRRQLVERGFDHDDLLSSCATSHTGSRLDQGRSAR